MQEKLEKIHYDFGAANILFGEIVLRKQFIFWKRLKLRNFEKAIEFENNSYFGNGSFEQKVDIFQMKFLNLVHCVAKRMINFLAAPFDYYLLGTER
mgnify:CR=1 FL=1